MLLQARSLSKKFEDRLLFSNLSFTIEIGKVYQVKGINGSGKSTLLKILAGLIAPTEGTIHRNSSCNVGYSSLELNLYPDLTVHQTLSWCAEIKKASLPIYSLPADQRVGTLSSGQLSYLKLILATLHSPKLLILDELHATLDLPNRQKFLTLIEHHQTNSAIIFTSHDQTLGIEVHQEIFLK